jgi:hypothetical protein
MALPDTCQLNVMKCKKRWENHELTQASGQFLQRKIIRHRTAPGNEIQKSLKKL